MLDVLTTRVILAAVALSVLVLFYLGTYRRNGSRYAAWWCVALLASGLGTAAYGLYDTPLEALSAPLGNCLGIVGTGFVWFAARAVGGRKPVWWLEAVLVVAVGAAAVLGDPAHDHWAGGSVLLVAMTLNLGFTTAEILRTMAVRRTSSPLRASGGVQVALRSMLVGAGGLAVFYLGRLVAYLVIGPDDPVFVAWFGPAVATVAITLVLVIATFSVSEVSHLEVTREYRERASYDDLTGLLTRGEFLTRAERWLGQGAQPAYAMMADLDHFKSLNDALGHAAGDRALRAFGAACRKAVEGQGLAGRVGGEEFAIILGAEELAQVRDVAAAISRRYAQDAPIRLGTPTVSYGVAAIEPGEPLESALARADAALYRAKRAGRDRFEVSESPAA